MELDVLRIVGQIAGIGGIALGVVLLLFREVIRKKIFPNLTKQQAYRLLRLLLVLVWCLALAGIAAWVVVEIGRDDEQPSGASEVQPPVGNVPWIDPSSYNFELALGGDDATVESVEWAIPIVRGPLEIPIEFLPHHELKFNLTNKALLDLHVVRVDVRTLDWAPLENAVGYYGEEPAGGGGSFEPPATFVAAVDSEINTYPTESTRDEEVVLKSKELDVFSVAVTAPQPGRYTLQFVVHYSIGGEAGVLELDPLDNVLFFDRNALPHFER
jgi:hypothetical protein